MDDFGRDHSGKFIPGHRGFKKPKTEFQRLTKTKLGDFLQSKLGDLDSIYEELPAKEKARLILACVEYFLPKMREHQVEIEESPQAVIDYSKLPEDVLRQILSATTIEPHDTNNL
jgi:hypothetical protein